MARREGRGHLSTIDRLPPEAWEDVQWARGQLEDSPLLQVEIRDELNRRLAAKGFAPISSSAFNRHSLRLATALRRRRDGQVIMKALGRATSVEEIDETTITLTQFMKTLALGLTTEVNSAKEALQLARAIAAIVSAQKGTLEYKRKLMGQTKERTLEAIDKVAAAVPKTIDGDALLRKVREDIYGIFDQ